MQKSKSKRVCSNIWKARDKNPKRSFEIWSFVCAEYVWYYRGLIIQDFWFTWRLFYFIWFYWIGGLRTFSSLNVKRKYSFDKSKSKTSHIWLGKMRCQTHVKNSPADNTRLNFIKLFLFYATLFWNRYRKSFVIMCVKHFVKTCLWTCFWESVVFM